MANPRFGEITDGGEHISKEIWDVIVAGLFDGDNYPIHLIVQPGYISENCTTRETYDNPTLYIIDNYLIGYQFSWDSRPYLNTKGLLIDLIKDIVSRKRGSLIQYKNLTTKLYDTEISYIKTYPTNYKECYNKIMGSVIGDFINYFKFKISDERINNLQNRIYELEKMNEDKSDIIQYIVETFKAIQTKQEEENTFIKTIKKLIV